MSFIKTVQIVSITTSLIASGGIATLSLFDVPELQSQPASRSLPMTRWLFSRGSHIFPSASFVSSAGFAILAYVSLPLVARGQSITAAITQLLKFASNSPKVNGYIAASALTLSIAPFTTIAMIPTNFRLIELNEKKGGSRSEKTARESSQSAGSGSRSAEDSVDGKNQPNQFTDLSGPQTQTREETSSSEDEEVKQLIGRFGALNACRAVLMGVGGIVGLFAALA